MQKVHFVAFCKLLNLPYEQFEKYCWDLVHYTPYITRKRNFFRNADDVEPIGNITAWCKQDVGPLLTPEGRVISFAPLLRTRKVHKYGVLHASWTLYQPQALVWEYGYWGGKDAFAQICRLGGAKIPSWPGKSTFHPLSWMRGKHFLTFFSEVIEPQPNLMISSLPFFPCSKAEPSNSPFDSLKQRRFCS